MATIVNNPGPSGQPVASDSGVAGWAVALIVVVIAGAALLWYVQTRGPGVPNTGDTNVNVTVPAPTDTVPGGAGAGGGGDASVTPAPSN